MAVDYSTERREQAVAWIHTHGLLGEQLTPYQRLLVAVALLVCNEAGLIDDNDMAKALDDPSVVQAARHLLRKAAYC